MFNQDDLVQQIEKRLQSFNYFREPDVKIPNVEAIYYVKENHPLKVRNLCAIIHSPDSGFDHASGRRFFEFIRKSLLDKYGQAFIWKELEISFIIICDHEAYENIVGDEGKIVDQASFSLNAMMGTFFINNSNYEHFLRSNWGIYFSGDHLNALNEIIDSWCAKQKEGLNESVG